MHKSIVNINSVYLQICLNDLSIELAGSSEHKFINISQW